MTVREAPRVPHSRGDVVEELPVWRLNLMRVGYLVMGLGLAVVKWPIVIGYDRSTPLFEGVVAVILTAMSLLAFLGLRYPVRLLPILLFESLWKLIWLGVVALPAVVAGDVDEAMREVIVNCSAVVIVFAVVPWRYVRQRYVAAKGDRWRGGGRLIDELVPVASPEPPRRPSADSGHRLPTRQGAGAAHSHRPELHRHRPVRADTMRP